MNSLPADETLEEAYHRRAVERNFAVVDAAAEIAADGIALTEDERAGSRRPPAHRPCTRSDCCSSSAPSPTFRPSGAP